jgi:acetyl esterase
MPSDLHPDCESLLALLRAANRPAYESLDVAAARAQYAAGRHVLQPPRPPVAEARDMAMPSGCRLRVYRPAGSSSTEVLPCLVFAHGGGWVFGDLETHDHLARSLANAAGCAVLAVDYRLAPEHPFPAAVEDMAEAVSHAVAMAGPLRINPTRIAVGGDSAGGNLAAVAAILSRNGLLPPLACQALIYPVTDMTQRHPSFGRFTRDVPLTAGLMRWFRGHYAPAEASWQDVRASPLRALSLTGLAPAVVLTVGHDPLRDEGIDYAQRLEAEGVRVRHLHASDLVHGALTMCAVVRPGVGLIRYVGQALANALG